MMRTVKIQDASPGGKFTRGQTIVTLNQVADAAVSRGEVFEVVFEDRRIGYVWKGYAPGEMWWNANTLDWRIQAREWQESVRTRQEAIHWLLRSA